jgi:hypothetical protein
MKDTSTVQTSTLHDVFHWHWDCLHLVSTVLNGSLYVVGGWNGVHDNNPAGSNAGFRYGYYL